MKKNILPELEYLIDPGEMMHVIEALRYKAENGLSGGPDMDLIIGPLAIYIETEFKRIGKHHIGTNAAMEFMLAAEDIKNCIADPARSLYDEHINLLERKWREWLTVIGWASWIDTSKYSKEQSEKGSKPRTRNGLNPEARQERDKKILADYEKSPMCRESFAEHHAKKKSYKKGNGEYLKKSAIKNIIKANQANDT